jgi:parvulin-like peptidyl-prolyl isomerase
MRVDCRILTVPTEDVAREALFAIQEDGEEMAEVAAGAGAEVREGTFYLEELEPGISDRVLAARKGELLGPLQTSEGYVLVDVLAKRLASVDDEVIRTRAEKDLFDSLVEREMDDRVTWRWGR